MDGHITIKRQTEGQDLYSQLRDKALKDVQRMAGEVWTDYNAHDPGVTLLDIANYALLEADYCLQFDWRDYLTSPAEGFLPESNLLFAPSSVFPVNPVTATDYRKLFISTVDELSDVRVITHPEGIYDFVLDVWPDTPELRRKQIAKEVYSLFHRHRNLCENLGEIHFLEYDMLCLNTEIEVDTTTDVHRLMATIFLEVQEFLRAGVRYRRIDDLLAEGSTTDEILDGPEQKRMVIDEASLCTDWDEYDLSWLYQKLRTLPGIRRISSLCFTDGEQTRSNTLRKKNHLHGYALHSLDSTVPNIHVTRDGKRVPASPEEVSRILYSLRASLYGAQNRATDKEILDAHPAGTYRDVFTHYPIEHDFPDHYKRHSAPQWKAYLSLFDSIFTEGLNELKELPQWMSANNNGLTEKKEQWMDVLDTMYGEDSSPFFLRKYENDAERRLRRISFLKDIPQWGKNRALGMRLLGFSTTNESGVETYLKRLLNLDQFGVEMFLVEHNLLAYEDGHFTVGADNCFRVSVVFLADDCRLTDNEFRHGCEQLLQSRMPAHIRMQVYWADRAEATSFRSVCSFWRYALSTSQRRGLKELSNKLKKMLDDDNAWYSKV